MLAALPPHDAVSWSEQNTIGRLAAIAIVETIRAEDLPIILGHKVKVMVERGIYGGEEVGFFNQIAVELIG